MSTASTAPLSFGGFGGNAGFQMPSWMTPVGNAIGGASAGFPTSTTTTGSGSSQGTFQQQGTSNMFGSSTPTFDPVADSLRKHLIDSSLTNLYSDTDLSGYKAQGLDTINRGTDANKAAIDATLASRGLSYSPMAATSEISNQLAGQGQKSQFVNNIPLLQQQIYQQKLAAALNVFRSNPYGTDVSQSGSTDSSGSQDQTYNNQQKTTSGGGIGGILSGIGSALALGGI